MRNIKNADNRLVAKLDEQSDTIVIKLKDCETKITRKPDGNYEIVNTKDALLKWADEVLKPAAQTAFAGEGDYCAGEHCLFCKIKAQCRERVNANLALAAYDFTDPVLLENTEIADILGKIDALTALHHELFDLLYPHLILSRYPVQKMIKVDKLR
jgi:hypothetical protein